MQEKQLMIYGGFELSTPNVPTDSIFRVSLTKLFETVPNLANKLRSFDADTSNNSMQSSSGKLGDSGISSRTQSPNTPNIRGGSISTTEASR